MADLPKRAGDEEEDGVYFREEPELNKPVLTSDCGSDVSAGAERGRLWDWNRCACHCLNITVQARWRRRWYTSVWSR